MSFLKIWNNILPFSVPFYYVVRSLWPGVFSSKYPVAIFRSSSLFCVLRIFDAIIIHIQCNKFRVCVCIHFTCAFSFYISPCCAAIVAYNSFSSCVYTVSRTHACSVHSLSFTPSLSLACSNAHTLHQMRAMVGLKAAQQQFYLVLSISCAADLAMLRLLFVIFYLS